MVHAPNGLAMQILGTEANDLMQESFLGNPDAGYLSCLSPFP